MTDFQLLITNWYRLNKRNLPWRGTQNPYFIWLSEIILQQTRVNQGMNYYYKFIEHYPTIQDLAMASEQEILNDWQGLGYYSRARNLHYTAKYICKQLENQFPTSFVELKKLKGVGSYTAAAIASSAFNEKVAVVDGNVYRFLSRIYNIETPIDSSLGIKEFKTLADELISEINPAEFNQAMMEFGAMHCTPVHPKCSSCPFDSKCLALKNNTISFRPVKSKKKAARKRFFYYSIFENPTEIVLQKREQKDIWQHLFEFPLLETENSLTDEEIIDHFEKDKYPKINHISIEYKHVLSHQHIFARFVHFKEIPSKFKKMCIQKSNFQDYPLPRLIDKYLQNKAR